MKAGAQDYLVKEQITPERLQLAVNGAIQTVQLHAQLLQRIERERVVAQITQKIHQTLDLGEILQMTVTEVRHFLSNDRVVIFRLHSDGWGNESGKPHRFRGINLDITDRKQAEIERDRLLQQEQAARALAEQANRAKDEFLAMLSHELRTPLNPILGWVKLLQTGKFEGAKMAQALATIERNVRLQTQLIDDLLNVAKIQPGKLNMDCVSVNLVAIVESAIDTVNTAAVAKSIWIVPVLSSIGLVFGDATRLQQVVWNLLSNAIKFTPNNGQVEIRLERVGDRAQIIVSDTGKGINIESKVQEKQVKIDRSCYWFAIDYSASPI